MRQQCPFLRRQQLQRQTNRLQAFRHRQVLEDLRVKNGRKIDRNHGETQIAHFPFVKQNRENNREPVDNGYFGRLGDQKGMESTLEQLSNFSRHLRSSSTERRDGDFRSVQWFLISKTVQRVVRRQNSGEILSDW